MKVKHRKNWQMGALVEMFITHHKVSVTWPENELNVSNV